MKRALILGVLLLAGCATTDSYVKQDGTALTDQEQAQLKVICGNYAESGTSINMAALQQITRANTTGTVTAFGNMATVNGYTTYNTAPDPSAALGATLASAIKRQERFSDCALAIGLKKKEAK